MPALVAGNGLLSTAYSMEAQSICALEMRSDWVPDNNEWGRAHLQILSSMLPLSSGAAFGSTS